ncbi:hypothetical protein AB0J83_01630 [Actinoplanes sp. NPDC049596]|uniref:hypothetical protein n=1 Tax=unclassified Actinoplanes TaxID=2626549 RepID=UPI0034185FBF
MIVMETGPAATAGDRDTIGGWPLLADGQEWPSCYCGERMVFFFQADLPEGEHLSVFQCPVHDDAAFAESQQLPERFWEVGERFWRIFVQAPGTAADQADPYVEGRRLTRREEAETVDQFGRGRPGFKLGGVPSWAQGPEQYRCACGTEMEFLAQVPENFGFDMWPMKPDHKDEQVQLFLGNELYILACPARCHPEAAWPVLQN